MSENPNDGREEARYRIGSVARLTGIAANTIRGWERRFGLELSSGRSEGGYRLYSEDDLQRLRLIARARQHGDPISVLAGLDTAQLAARVAAYGGEVSGAGPAGSSPPIRVVCIGATLCEALADPSDDFVVRASLAGPDDVQAYEPGAIDLVVCTLEALGSSPVEALGRLRARAPAVEVAVELTFANRRVRQALSAAGARLLRVPYDVSALQRPAVAASSKLLPASADERTAPKFSDSQLLALAAAETSLDCECPNHLAAILTQLISFERYTLSCVVDAPEDAVLHRQLARETARARSVVERMLAAVCAHEGLNV